MSQNMQIRALKSSDLKVTKGWFAGRGRQRIFVSLRQASFVNKTYWLTESQQALPETLERIKKDLSELADKKFLQLGTYFTQ
jgi:hypothetical protein